MGDYILIDGDKAVFMPTFGAAIVAVRPGTLNGSGKPTLCGSKICLEGDEKQLSVPGCSYITALYSVPGTGTLTIESLAGDQKTERLLVSGKHVLLRGSRFSAKFTVISPALLPVNPTRPDNTPEYSGQGQFITENLKWTSC